MITRNFVRRLECLQVCWLYSLIVQVTDAALLVASFPPEASLAAPRSTDNYCFVLSVHNKPNQQQCYVATNFTTPVFTKLPPDTWFNVTVIANDLPLLDLTRAFLSGPDAVQSLSANVTAPNETVVSWLPPVGSPVSRYRVQLLTRDPVTKNTSRGVPMDWDSNQIRIAPLIAGGEYAIEVVALNGVLQSEPARISFMQYPSTPSGFRRLRTGTTETSISLAWDPPEEGFVDAYYLTANASVQPNTTLLPSTALTIDFQNLESGSSYLFTLASVRGNWSTRSVQLIAATKPKPPRDFRLADGEVDANSLSVVWTTGSAGADTFYQATINASAPDVWTVNTTENQFVFRDLLPATDYLISAEAVVRDGEVLLFSNPIKKIFRTGSAQVASVVAVEGAPELLLQTNDNTVRFLEANATSEDPGAVIGNVINAQHVLFKDLVGGTRYVIYSKMLHNDIEEIVSFQKLTYPFPPVNVSIKSTSVTTESVVLQWSLPINTRFQGYQILYNRLDDNTINLPNNYSSIVLPVPGATNFNVSGLVPGSKYAFRMQTTIENERSVETLPVLQCTRPLKPLAVSVRATSVKLILQLTRPSNTTKYYRISLVNLDQKEAAPRNMEIRNDSAVVMVSIPIDYLGAVYEVRVASYVCDLLSEVVAVVVHSLPPVVNFNRPPAEVTQTSIKLVYQITWPIMRSVFERYAFQINDFPPKYILPGESKAQTIEFTELIPGTRYTVFGWTERGGIQSDRKSVDVQLKPDNVTSLNATKITSHSISFEWQPPTGAVTEYEIGYNNSEPLHTNATAWTFSNLLPYTVYSVYAAAFSGTERSSALTKFYTTLEDKPGKVRLFTLSALHPYKLLGVRWMPPDAPNGLITNYLLDYRESSTDAPWTQLSFPSQNLTYVLTLTPGVSYVLRIAAVNKAGIGPAQDGSISMPIGAPLLARSSIRPAKLSSTKNQIVIEFNKDFFLDDNGEITKYAVIVSEDPSQNVSAHPLGWKDVQSYSTWPPYQATDYFNPFVDSNQSSRAVTAVDNDVAQVIVGGDQNCEKSPDEFCNGPLKENTQFFVKLRAFTSFAQNSLLYTDTVYTEPIATVGSGSVNALAVALGIIIPVICLILLALAFVMMRRRNWGPFVKKARKAVVKTADDKISIAESLPEKSRPVKLRDFTEHMRMMSADSDFKFSEEYEDLKNVGRDQSCIAADLPINRAKNRFTNILPYDHSRVKLTPTDDEEGSDYMNANYMPGQSSPREFIVTQGPLPGTRDDFWRMVWEQNCRAIVMLTRCVEKGREKCDHYWPYDTDPIVYGNIEIVVMNETQTVDWTIREFRVQMNDEPARSVRHFHFTAWPDFGVPERPQTLIKFVRAFRDRVSNDMKPIICHCSAGVGRSGTFIALDRLLQQIKFQDYVDIFGMVVEMRKERVWMVQTEQQYICIHQCLLCVLEKREDDPRPSSIMHENAGYEISDDEGIVESGPF